MSKKKVYKCDSCGAEVKDTDSKCPECGKEFEVSDSAKGQSMVAKAIGELEKLRRFAKSEKKTGEAEQISRMQNVLEKMNL